MGCLPDVTVTGIILGSIAIPITSRWPPKPFTAREGVTQSLARWISSSMLWYPLEFTSLGIEDSL